MRWAIPREALITQGFRMTYALDPAGHIAGCTIAEFHAHDPDLTCSAQMVEQIAQTHLAHPLRAYAAVSLLMAMQVDDDARIDLPQAETDEHTVLAKAAITVWVAGMVTACKTEQVAQFGGRTLDLCAATVHVGEKAFAPQPGGHPRTLVVTFEVHGVPR